MHDRYGPMEWVFGGIPEGPDAYHYGIISHNSASTLCSCALLAYLVVHETLARVYGNLGGSRSPKSLRLPQFYSLHEQRRLLFLRVAEVLRRAPELTCSVLSVRGKSVKNCVESRLSQQSAGLKCPCAACAGCLLPNKLTRVTTLAAMHEARSQMLLETRRYQVGSDA